MPRNVVPMKPRKAGYSPAVAAEALMEVQAQLHTVRTFVGEEMRISWERGHDVRRMRSLQKADAAVRVIDAQAKRFARWASECADGIEQPGHGAAA